MKKRYCKYCGNELFKGQITQCNSKCQAAFQSEEKIKAWLSGKFDGLRGGNQLSLTIRNYLLKQANYKCELCGWGEVNPITGLVPLEIHHKDGNYLNNSPENLQVLCPNCHSLTPNFKALNKSSERERTTVRKNYCIDCGKEISKGSSRCRECSDKQKITVKPVTREELKEKIRKIPFTTIGKEYNVTDNTIRKWCIGYNLPSKKRDIEKYSDEDWNNL